MKKILILFFLMLSISVVFGQQNKEIGILFTGNDSETANSMMDQLMSALEDKTGYEAYDRTADFQVARKRQYGGKFTDELISKIGRDLGLSYVCVVNVNNSSSDVTIQIVDVSKKSVIAATENNIRKGNQSAINRVVDEMVTDLYGTANMGNNRNDNYNDDDYDEYDDYDDYDDYSGRNSYRRGGSSSLKDPDGNSYASVTIGNQVWMVENLRTTKLNDGTPIALLEESKDWVNTEDPAYCWYDNNKSSYSKSYGALYNWNAVSTGKLCPKGWRVPSDKDWDILITHLGGAEVAGGKLKETGNEMWKAPNEGANNESGFKALPGGYRNDYDGNFHLEKSYGYWWSSTESSPKKAWRRNIAYNDKKITRMDMFKNTGLSVRCIKE